jgi:hypothetical protein
MQDQAPLGPEAGLAIPAEDGGIDLIVSTQWLHVDRQQIAPCLNLPEEKVRITLAGVGGAFGSREDLHMQIHACMLALHTGRPVKMSYGRPESFLAHVHRTLAIWIRRARRDLVNVRARILIDGGAYTSSSIAVIRPPFAPAPTRPNAHRGDLRVHQQSAVWRDAGVRRRPGVLRARGADGQARGGPLDGSGGAPAAQRGGPWIGAPDRPGDPRRGAGPRGDRAVRRDPDAAGHRPPARPPSSHGVAKRR